MARQAFGQFQYPTSPLIDVVVGVDVADSCDEVIEFAFRAARLRHARLRAVHAWHAPSALSLGPGEVGLVDDPQQTDEWLGFLSAVLQAGRGKYPTWRSWSRSSRAGQWTRSSGWRPERVSLSSGTVLAQRPVGPRAGPVTYAVIDHVGCPVAVVPHA